MGWTEQIPNLVIIETGTGFTGLFVYDPAPGTGNLIVSIAPPGIGSDPYGNPITGDGLTVYDALASGEARQIFVGPRAISLRTGAVAEATHARVGDNIIGTLLQLQLISPSTTGAADIAEIDLNSNNTGGTSVAQGLIVYNDTAAAAHNYATWDASGFNVAAGSIVGVTPGTGTLATPATAETWHSLGSPTATGFTSNIGQYRLTAEGETEIDVKLTANAGGGTAGTYSYANTLPAAYRTPTTRIYPLGFNSTYVSAAAANALIVNSSGVVQVKVSALVAATIAGTTVRVPLNI